MRRAAWRLAGVLGLLLALLAAAAAWWATSASGLRGLAAAAVYLSRGQLAIEGVDGRWGAPITIRKLTFATDTRRITLERARLQWQPRALLQRRLDIDLLAVQAVRIEMLKPDRTPPSLPATLRLPLALRVAAWQVARLEVVDAGRMLGFDALHGALDDSGDRYRLSAAATAPWADLRGQLGIDKDAPFRLQGRVAAAQGKSGAPPLKAEFDLSGRLAAIMFRMDARAGRMRFMAAGEAAPFARVRLPRLLVAGQGIDPRQFSAAAPHADLAFSGVFEGQPGERLLGTFSLANRQAGRLDQDRLPLANLTGALLGDSTQADFSALLIDLGAAGQLSGGGQWRGGRFSVNLTSARLDLAGLHRALHATRIRAGLLLAGDATRQTLEATLQESWGQGRASLARTGALLELRTAQFSGQAGQVDASGSLRLDAGRAFAVAFDARAINPARFGDFPRARLNARGMARGALRPELSLQTQFTLPPGELEGRPVRGHGRLHYAGGRLADADLDLDLAGNRARFKGAYGRAGDRLDWDVDAPMLARLNLGLAGRLRSTGSASGAPAQPDVDARIDASGLRLPGAIAVESLALRLQFQAAASGAFNGQMEARGLQFAGQRISFARASAQGRRNAHTLTLDARLPGWRLEAALTGGLDVDRWRGQLVAAEIQGAWPMTLLAPATLVLGRAQQQANGLAFTLAGGQVNVASFNRQGAYLATRGSLANLPLAPLLALLESSPAFSTDLRVNGDWDLRLGDTLDGQAHLRRHSGDVRLADPPTNLGLIAVALDFNAAASQAGIRLAADSREAGTLRADASAALARAGSGWSLPRTAPLAWTAALDVPDLRLIRSLLPAGVRLDARLAAQLAGSGSLAAPRIDGRIDASRIRFALPEEGVAISDGTLKLLLAGDRVRVSEGELKGPSEIRGGGGRILVSGEAQLKNPQAGLNLTFDKFAAIQRSDRRVTVSGVTRLNLDQKQLQLSGELTADRARLEMPEAGRPALSSDVVIVGQPPRARPPAQRLPLALDLRLGLGDDFLFKGGGLDARLGGTLRVFSVNTTLRGEGSIRVEKGRYAAYAQTLDIERGVLRFAGPIDNPGLDVLAVRKSGTVKAGVRVGGTVQQPLVRLYSDPPMPDTETLAWLVLGHGLDGGGQQEFLLLQVAAGALLSQAESVNVQTRLAEALRIDSFSLRAGEGEHLGATVVSVGKRLSARATLSYEQSLDGLSQVVKVLYQLNPQVRLEAQGGQQSSFDVFYSREYD